MKQVTITVPIKTNGDSVTNISKTYDEVETLQDLSSFPSDKVIKIFNTGLRMIMRNKVRADNNFSSLVQKLIAAELFKTEEEALNFIVEQKKLRGQL